MRRPSRRTLLATVTGGLLASAGCLEEPLDERGTLEIHVDNEPVDLTADRFQAEHADEYAMAFHLHEFDGYWYM